MHDGYPVSKLDTLSHFAMLENLDLILALDLSGNALKSLTLSELEIFDNLRYLKLAQNEIGHIYRTRHPIQNLEHVDLSENNIVINFNLAFKRRLNPFNGLTRLTNSTCCCVFALIEAKLSTVEPGKQI